MNITRKDFEDIPFKTALEAAPNAMIITNDKGIIVFINKQTELLFGYSEDELLGKSIEILVPPAYRDQHPKDRGQFYNKPTPRKTGIGRDLHGLRKDLKEIAVEIGLAPIELSGEKFVISSIIDISARVKAEKNLKDKSIELEKSNAELEQFAYIASHDLQAPLRHITSYVQLLNKELEDQLSDKTKQWMGFVTAGAKRMQELINGLLSFSRLSRVEIDFKLLNFNQIVEDSLLNLSQSIKESGVIFKI
ncbi:MAG: PAS domain S-box protein, partial [Bdellovibrionales bacterium]|nr:PAS domain S-box protein [Bdellovibrionales bacterium]